MTRRSATLTISAVLVVALIAVASLLPVPYVVYSPGPVEDTLGEWNDTPVVQVDGAETYPTEGELNLTTVGVTPADVDMDLFTALQGWLDPNRAVVPRDHVYPPGVTAEQTREENAQMLVRSQETAKVAALTELGYDVPADVQVDQVVDGSPADGVLQPGDVIKAVDGTAIATQDDVVEAITSHEPGDDVAFTIQRGDETIDLTVGTIKAEDDGRTLVGFMPVQGYEFPVDITIGIDERIGGPSAGLIFALAIYDTLTPGAMLEGHEIAGTGTIDADGQVGAIGGIPQKIAAAEADGADLFLAPRLNCDEAVDANNGDMLVVPVETFGEALSAVESFVGGDTDDLPDCPA